MQCQRLDRTLAFLISSWLVVSSSYPTWAACPSRTFAYTSGNVIDPTQNTTNETNVYDYLCAGVDTYATGSIGTAALADNAVTSVKIAANVVGVADLAQLTNGQLFIGSTSANLVAATLTGTASEVDITNGAGSITIGIVNPLGVAQGGTGAASTTTGQVVVGQGTSAMVARTLTAIIDKDGNLTMPQGTNPTVDSPGEIAQDTTDDQLLYGSTPRVIPYAGTRCLVIEDLVAADDNISLGMWNDATTITGIGCSFVGTGTTVATIALEDGSANAMTHTGPTCVAHGTNATFQSVTAANGVVAGEIVRFDTTNTPSPSTDDYSVCITFVTDRQ